MSSRKLLAFALGGALLAVLLMAQVGTRPQTLAEWQISTTSPQLPAEFAYISINKFGFNGAVGTTPEVVWSNSGAFSYPVGAVTMSIVSDDVADDGDPAGTGARTVRIYCLDASGVPAQEDLTLDGTTPVSMAGQCLKSPYRVKVLTAGSSGANVGTLTVSEGGTTYAEVGEGIAPGDNQTLQAAYTCPAGVRCILEWTELSTDDNVLHGVFIRPSGEVFRPMFWLALDTERARITWWQCIPALADIEYRAAAVAGSADIGAAFRLHHIAHGTGACG